MSEQIKKLVQLDDPILNNLVDTENRLNELNQEVGAIVNEYQETNRAESSFFNFDNPFFLLTLVGLFMLAFALWFLKQELKHFKPKKIKPAKVTKPEIKAKPVKEIRTKEKLVEKTSPKKVRKIKVVKIK